MSCPAPRLIHTHTSIRLSRYQPHQDFSPAEASIRLLSLHQASVALRPHHTLVFSLSSVPPDRHSFLEVMWESQAQKTEPNSSPHLLVPASPPFIHAGTWELPPPGLPQACLLRSFTLGALPSDCYCLPATAMASQASRLPPDPSWSPAAAFPHPHSLPASEIFLNTEVTLCPQNRPTFFSGVQGHLHPDHNPLFQSRPIPFLHTPSVPSQWPFL